MRHFTLVQQPVLRLLISTLLLLLQATEFVKAQDSTSTEKTWTGCVDRSRPGLVQIGEPTRVCLQVANGVDWASGVQYTRASFEPAADEYSKFHIPNSYQDLVGSNSGSIFTDTNITIGAASQSALSFLRLYYDFDRERVYPFFTAIMDVEKGIVKGITWDDSCVFCGGFADACEENTYTFVGQQVNQKTSGQHTKSCFIPKADCDKLAKEDPTNTACDVTLHTVWSGTDFDGKALQSQAYRYSEFPVQELSDRFTQSIPTFGLGGYFSNKEDDESAATKKDDTTAPTTTENGDTGAGTGSDFGVGSQ